MRGGRWHGGCWSPRHAFPTRRPRLERAGSSAAPVLALSPARGLPVVRRSRRAGAGALPVRRGAAPSGLDRARPDARAALRQLAATRGGPALSISIGVADLERAGASEAGALYRAADAALYAAKASGRDRVTLAPAYRPPEAAVGELSAAPAPAASTKG